MSAISASEIAIYKAILRRALEGTDVEVDEFFEKVIFGDECVIIDVATRNLVYIPMSAFFSSREGDDA